MRNGDETNMPFVCKECNKIIGEGILDYCFACIIPIVRNYNSNKKPIHQTEKKYPEQTRRFREILDEMYQTHLQKNADYSPYNILVTGMKGCVTRLWDKSARFFNLMGLDIGKYTWNEEKMNTVADEPVEQTLIDWANYCIITRILREGKWGK